MTAISYQQRMVIHHLSSMLTFHRWHCPVRPSMGPDLTISARFGMVLLSRHVQCLFLSAIHHPNLFVGDKATGVSTSQGALIEICSAALIILRRSGKLISHIHIVVVNLLCWSRTTSLDARCLSAHSTARQDHTLRCLKAHLLYLHDHCIQTNY